MSAAAPTCNLAIALDRPEASYRLGDQVAGKVTVEAPGDCHCERLTIAWEWRAGSGKSLERGGTVVLELFRGNWPEGHKEAYPFAFPVPAGPVSCPGETFAVSWWLKAHADLRHADVSAESEFRVLPPQGSEPDLGPGHLAPVSIPAETRPPSEPYWWLLVGLCFAGLGLAMLAVLLGAVSDLPLPVMTTLVLGPGSPFIAPFLIAVGGMTVGTGMIVWQILSDARLGPLGATHYQLSARQGLPGDAFNCGIEFRPRVAGRLDGIWVGLFREERVLAPARKGETESWKTVRTFEREVCLAGGRDLRKGVAVSAGGVLTIPADGLPTFEAERHAAIWFVRFLVKVADQPEFARKFRITVRPGAFLEAVVPPAEAPPAAPPETAASAWVPPAGADEPPAEPAVEATVPAAEKVSEPSAEATMSAAEPAAPEPPRPPDAAPAPKTGLQALLDAADDLPPELQGRP